MSGYRYDEEYTVEKDLFSGENYVYNEYGDCVGTTDDRVEYGDYQGCDLASREGDIAFMDSLAANSSASSDTSCQSDTYNTYDNDSSSSSDDAAVGFSVFMIGVVPILLTLLVFQGDGGALLFVGPIFAMILVGIMTVIMSIASSIIKSVKKS